MRPALASMSSTTFGTDASSVTSQVSMDTPSARSAAARRLVPNTRKPAFCRALAVACPMPVDAPVTRATPGLVLLMEITSFFVIADRLRRRGHPAPLGALAAQPEERPEGQAPNPWSG